MANVKRISAALTADMVSIVRQAVASGDYASASKVVRDALREWQQRRAVDRGVAKQLRRLWDEGLASGPVEPLDMAAIKREARARLSA
ncbi:MAG: type II toxin-antitoxin system ParD family antitoxin [Geminicoccaceae bacterium]